MTGQSVFDQHQTAVILGPKSGGGGEGTVFAIANLQNRVAKIFNPQIAASKGDKVRSMIPLGSAELFKVAAWPLTTLHDRAGGPAIGYAMPAVKNHKELHLLYGPSHRKTAFPDADWNFLIHLA